MKTVELLLTKNVGKLGIVGDVVNVKAGYARNFLLPYGLATDPTKGNIARLAEARKKAEAEMKAQRAVLEKLAVKIDGFELTMERAANEQGVLFGGVSQHDITQALQAEGFAIDDRMVRIGDQIKRLDSYEIPVVLASDLRTEIKIWVVSDKPATQEDDASADALEDETSAESETQAADETETETETEAAAE